MSSKNLTPLSDDDLEGVAGGFGEGGVIYTEAFTLNADKATDSGDVTIIDLGFMDFIFAMVDRYGGLFGRIIGNLFN